MISFRSVLVLGGLCVLALIVSAIAKGKHKKTEDISLNVFVFLVLATVCMAGVWLLKVGTHGVRYVAHEAIAAQAKAKAEADKKAQEANTEKAADIPSPPAKANPPVIPQAKTIKDNVALLAAVMTYQLQQRGSDVTVLGFDDTLIFDCSKALDPRTICYVLYKTWPKSQDVKAYRGLGVRILKFQTEAGLFSGYAWTKPI